MQNELALEWRAESNDRRRRMFTDNGTGYLQINCMYLLRVSPFGDKFEWYRGSLAFHLCVCRDERLFCFISQTIFI